MDTLVSHPQELLIFISSPKIPLGFKAPLPLIHTIGVFIEDPQTHFHNRFLSKNLHQNAQNPLPESFHECCSPWVHPYNLPPISNACKYSHSRIHLPRYLWF